MYCFANWFNLVDEACEDALYEIATVRDFCQVDRGCEGVPDATTLLNFRHLLEKHDLGAAIFAKVGELLLANDLKLCGGTIVDAAIIDAPSSTKSLDKARDPEMHQTYKAGQWYFGMKAHIGVDSATGLIQSASVTAANEHDSQRLGNLLHGAETRLYGDSAYRGQRDTLKGKAPQAKDFTNQRAYRNKPLTERDKGVNPTKSRVRSKVRYRGLAKNANRAFAMLALINIERWSRAIGCVGAPQAPSQLPKWVQRRNKTSEIHEKSTSKD